MTSSVPGAGPDLDVDKLVNHLMTIDQLRHLLLACTEPGYLGQPTSNLITYAHVAHPTAAPNLCREKTP